MKGLRRSKWLRQTVLFAVAALVWSQLALAGHGACLGAATTPPALAAHQVHAVQGGGDCHAQASQGGEALCAEHCDDHDLTTEQVRALSVPPLFIPAWMPPLVSMVHPSTAMTRWIDDPPEVRWKRPTTHPAALLLI